LDQLHGIEAGDEEFDLGSGDLVSLHQRAAAEHVGELEAPGGGEDEVEGRGPPRGQDFEPNPPLEDVPLKKMLKSTTAFGLVSVMVCWRTSSSHLRDEVHSPGSGFLSAFRARI
jgi:hypothetical protein